MYLFMCAVRDDSLSTASRAEEEVVALLLKMFKDSD